MMGAGLAVAPGPVEGEPRRELVEEPIRSGARVSEGGARCGQKPPGAEVRRVAVGRGQRRGGAKRGARHP